MKNCDPFVSGPEFAIDNIPAPVVRERQRYVSNDNICGLSRVQFAVCTPKSDAIDNC